MRKVVFFSLDRNASILLRSLASALQIDLSVVTQWSELKTVLGALSAKDPLIIVGLDAIIPTGKSAPTAIARLREVLPAATIVLNAERRMIVDAADQAWAAMCGANGVLPRMSAHRWRAVGPALTSWIANDAALADRLMHRTAPFVRAAMQLEEVDASIRALDAAESKGIDLPALAVRMARSGGVNIRDRAYHLRNYPECFIASEGVNWIAKALNTSAERAIAVGQAMQAAGLIYHVAREQAFGDAYYFFRVAKFPQPFVIADFHAQVRSVVGFANQDRTHHGTEYKQCFIGKEAIAWCQKRNMSLNEAMSAGQRLIDLSIVSHVANEHPMKDDHFFYRFHAA
jgi:Domain found in Dishevelled, Egl-10, and Pleckstrin (DEP)